MIWGLGTGRCGTKSLAADLGGVHEPQPWLGELPAAWANGLLATEDRLIALLKRRLLLSTPAVVDLKHSFIIPLILRVDPRPEFVWLIRHPIPCVRSLAAPGNWEKPGHYGMHFLHPVSGWGRKVDRLGKIIWYWKSCNALIFRHLVCGTAPFKVVQTSELKSHENRYPPEAATVLSSVDARRILDYCGADWEFYTSRLCASLK